MSENNINNKIYDLIIIGGGPAGLSAGLYGSRGGLSTLILEKFLTGGELNNTNDIENYPGVYGKSGPELASMLKEHALKFGVEIKELVTIHEASLNNKLKLIKTDQGDFQAKTVIIATGSEHRKLNVSGESEFAGRGVSYCATCDGAFFKDKHVVVVGGGNAAIEEAIFLTKFVSKLTIIHRRDKLRAEKIVQDRAFKNPKINFIWDTVILKISGEQKVKNILLKNLKTQEEYNFDCDGVFVFIGLDPSVELVKNQVKLDEANRIITDEKLETSIKGVFAAGDVRVTQLRQAVNATADGALSAVSATNYLEQAD